ncbi:MAG TPA: hypothetical protein VK688_09495 [Gemmatimonadales bacterium]|jgi:hypothetical protein|nr:hypothetical protein [Gemmatimonadales bacterium]
MSGSLRIALGAALCLLAGPGGIVAAQSASREPVPLEFHGFRAGAHLSEIAAQVERLDGTSLKCVRARVDKRISECRAMLTDPDFGGPVEIWLSAVDSVASVMTLSGEVAPDQLDQWRSGLESRYGRVGAKVRGSQWAMQWIRHNRMIRLTWRIEHASKVASVALVDGAVLDAWGRERARRSASRS